MNICLTSRTLLAGLTALALAPPSARAQTGASDAGADRPAARAQAGAPESSRSAAARSDTTAPTRVVIRAISRDAKIVGDGVGGAMIRVVDAATGATLAEGVQTGSTGDTERIMSTPRTRGQAVYDTEGAAAFVAELAIDRPTLVNISARGPLEFPQAIQTATKRMLLVPGGHIEGEGVLLELHGFIVEILEPEPLDALSGSARVRARVRMSCGCPLTPGGMWDANGVEVRARLLRDGAVVTEAPLSYAGESSTFSGNLPLRGIPADTDLELEVLAADPATQNFGRHVIPVQAAVRSAGER